MEILLCYAPQNPSDWQRYPRSKPGHSMAGEKNKMDKDTK